MKNKGFNIASRARSFRYAFEGIGTLLKEEANFKIHCCALAAVIILGFALGISSGEWCAVAICCGSVLAGEAMNSAVEALCDLVSPEFNPLIKKAKDVAAAGVLMTALAAAACGLIIFVPKIAALFG